MAPETAWFALPGVTPRQRWLFASIFVLALPIDLALDLPGQCGLSVAIWGLFLSALASLRVEERIIVWTCVAIATAGELFLSVLWGLYSYRLGNIPFFIPPGHGMLYILALGLAPRIPPRLADAVLAGAVIYGLVAGLAGWDTFAVLLLGFAVLVAANSRCDRPLYASTFCLALALELYGVWLGSWSYVTQIPVFPLVTTNPPGLISVFYVVLDMLVACIAVPLIRRLHARRGSAVAIEPFFSATRADSPR